MNLTYLFLLACPIGMGLMMWMMIRGSGQQQQTQAPPTQVPGLHQQLQSLERQQAAIMDQIQRLREVEPEVVRDANPSSDVPREPASRAPALGREA